LLVVLSACDETGKLIFNESDAELINSKNADAIEKIYNVAMRLNGLSGEASKQAQETFQG